MKRQLLLLSYPRAWRERYGEELSAQLESEGRLRIDVVADVMRGAIAAHLHPLRRASSAARISNITDRGTVAARATVVWSPVAAVAIAAVIVLVDFWYGHPIWFVLIDAFGARANKFVVMAWYRSDDRFFPAEQLYDLALHMAIVAVALAGALIFAAMVRKKIRGSEPVA
jgi:hypothetical protein